MAAIGAWILFVANVLALAPGSAQAADAPQDRTRIQAQIDDLSGRIRAIEEREARASRVRQYLDQLSTDPGVVVVRARDFNGWVPMPAERLRELVGGSLSLWYLAGEEDSLLPSLVEVFEASERHKQKIRSSDLPALDRRIAEFARERSALEQQRERLLAAFSRPGTLRTPEPPATPRDVDLRGTWRPAQGGPDVVTLSGTRGAYTLTGTNGRYKHSGTIKLEGHQYHGDLVDEAGFCCGRQGEVWIEVIDDNTYRARSNWWKPPLTTRENPEIPYGWSTWKRSTK